MVAAWHMLTTGYEDTTRLQSDTWDMVLDWLGAGLDPERSVIFVQSQVKEHAELHLLFSMLVSKARLERIPTLKEQIRDLHLDEQTISYGHLGYSVLQAADILLYKATHVPVGEDQVPHVELTREIARRFNFVYCQDRDPVFPGPEARPPTRARAPPNAPDPDLVRDIREPGTQRARVVPEARRDQVRSAMNLEPRCPGAPVRGPERARCPAASRASRSRRASGTK